jgi:hypothetical protein
MLGHVRPASSVTLSRNTHFHTEAAVFGDIPDQIVAGELGAAIGEVFQDLLV